MRSWAITHPLKKRNVNWRYRFNELICRARSRAKKKGLPFDLTIQWALTQLALQNYNCARTGIELQLSCPETRRASTPFGPSLDRVDSSKGYTVDNVEVVCNMYNCAKNRFTSEDVVAFAAALLSHQNIVIANN